MTSVLIVVGGGWLVITLLFTVALCRAASRPLPSFELATGEEGEGAGADAADPDNVGIPALTGGRGTLTPGGSTSLATVPPVTAGVR